MKRTERGIEEIKIAYIGGGSRGWAWGLMSDLASAADISGEVRLYDIDYTAAKNNEIIGNKFGTSPLSKSKWTYTAEADIKTALDGADFVVISILPATFDEMESDVHTPEKYGIYQSVGDSTGPGGIIRALRAMPMMRDIAIAIKKVCPKAWVINHTNPMALCTKALYDTFPEIKAFGCCHEVFGTQKLLCDALEEIKGIRPTSRSEIKVNVLGVNHFTWITEAKYGDIDLFPIYAEFAERHKNGIDDGSENWLNRMFKCTHKVKFDLFKKHGAIAAAGDRHLAEFCDGNTYLKNPDTVREWGFGLTPVSWRKENLKNRLARSARLISGEEEIKIATTGEEGVNQLRAILGLGDLVTNVNMPNRGQIPNLPLGAIVETNAIFSCGSVKPIPAGDIPSSILPMVERNVKNQLLVAEAAKSKRLAPALAAFITDPLVTVDEGTAKALFCEMVENTKKYLDDYEKNEI